MTLLVRDQENIEKGIQQGIRQGIEQSIYGVIAICQELRLSDDEISEKLQGRFNLSEEEAQEYLQESERELACP